MHALENAASCSALPALSMPTGWCETRLAKRARTVRVVTPGRRSGGSQWLHGFKSQRVRGGSCWHSLVAGQRAKRTYDSSATAAVSARSRRSPSPTGRAPAATSAASSCGVQSPSGPMHRMPCRGCCPRGSAAATSASGGAPPVATSAASAPRILLHSWPTLAGAASERAWGRRHCFMAAVATRAQRPSRPLPPAGSSSSPPSPAPLPARTAGRRGWGGGGGAGAWQQAVCPEKRPRMAPVSAAERCSGARACSVQAGAASNAHSPQPSAPARPAAPLRRPGRLLLCARPSSPPPLPMVGDRSVSSGVKVAAPSSAHFSTSQSERPPFREPQAQATSHCQPVLSA